MSDDARQPEDPTVTMPQAAETISPVPLRREALLPNERGRGLGTVAVVCTMAGVASGLALATTLMAMQVADTMSARSSCSYRQIEVTPIEVRHERDHGFLGIRYVFQDGVAVVDSILPGTPAEDSHLRAGDRVLSVNNDHIDSANELQERIYMAQPGSQPVIKFERDGVISTVRPTLIAWPTY
jgi:S1-C subfamily serine protease